MPDNNSTLQQDNDTLTLGDFMTLKDSNAKPQVEVSSYEDFMGQPAPQVNITQPVPEEHKNTFLLDLGLRFTEGIQYGFTSFNDLLGYVTGLNKIDSYKKTFVTPGQELHKQVAELTQPENLGSKIAYDFAGHLGNLGVTLPIDMMTGGATKAALAGKALPAVEAILAKVPNFVLGSGWRGLVTGFSQAKNPVEAVPLGLAKAGEDMAFSTLYAYSPTGLKGLSNMIGIGAAGTYYEAAKEGRLPSKDEVIQGASEGAAYSLAFSIIPAIREGTKVIKEEKALGEYQSQIDGHLQKGDFSSAINTVEKILTDERIRPQIKEAINKTLEPKPARKPLLQPQLAEGFYQKVVNRFQSIENLTDKAKELGANIEPGKDPALSAERYLSIANQAKNTLEQGTFQITREGNVIHTGEGLKPILDNYDAVSRERNAEIRHQELKDYLISTRTVKDLQRPRSATDQENIATPEQVEAGHRMISILNRKYGGDISHLEQTAQRLYDYQRRVLHLLVGSGNLSQKSFNDILARNPNYVPFDRILPQEEKASVMPVSKGRFDKAKSPVKRIKGSELEIQDPIESMIKNTYKIMDIAARNKVWNDVYALKSIPDLGIKEVSPDMMPVAKLGNDEVIFRPSMFKPAGNVLEGYIDGKRKYIEVSRNLYEAMSGLNETSSGMLVKILSKPAQWLRVGATTTPEFILRNPIRDQWTALIQTNLGWKPFIDSGSAIADILNKNEAYNDWIRSGGSYAGFVELSRPRLAQMLGELQGNKNLLANLNIVTKLGEFSQLMEQATRVGVYKAGVAKGLSSVEAAKQSREATVDFARRGAMTRDLNATIAFFNAGIQGLDKTIRTVKQDPVGATVKATTAITIPSLLLYIINRSDPEYKELPRWQKDLFWLFKINDIWFRVPKPFVYGQVFGSLPERFFEYVDSQDPQAFNRYGESLYNSLSPVTGDPMSGLLPTALKPLIENQANYSFFRDRPIVGEAKKDLLPAQQYNSRYDTKTSRLLGKIFNVSPSKVENLTQGWFGGMGRYALQSVDVGMKFIDTLRGAPIEPGKPVELSDLPLVKGFVSKDITTGQAESVKTFYDNLEKVSRAYLTYNQLKKEGSKEEALSIKEKYPELQLYPKFSQYANKFSDLEKKVDAVVKSNLTEEEKRAGIRELELKKIEMAKKANELLNGRE